MSFVIINTICNNVGVVCNNCEECITELTTKLSPGDIINAIDEHSSCDN